MHVHEKIRMYYFKGNSEFLSYFTANQEKGTFFTACTQGEKKASLSYFTANQEKHH